MTPPRTAAISLGAAAAAALAAFAWTAQAQPSPQPQIVGYAVYAHSHYVLQRQPDGRLRACSLNRQTALNRSPQWECTAMPALP